MSKYGQFVMGPAGSGKSTYCRALVEHCRVSRIDKRNIKLINLDPGAEDSISQSSANDSALSREIPSFGNIAYDIDIRDLITVADVMEDMAGYTSPHNSSSDENESGHDGDNNPPHYTPKSSCYKTPANENIIGPNGALIYCMEYLAKDDFAWLNERIENDLVEGDYVLFDCPGQIELYTHVPAVKRLVEYLTYRASFRLCGLFLVDAAHFLVEMDKYISVTLTALSVMINLDGIPFINIFSKMDIVKKAKSLSPLTPFPTLPHELIQQLTEPNLELYENLSNLGNLTVRMGSKYERLTRTIATVIDSYDLIRFQPLNLNKKSSIDALLYYVDTALQFDEDREPRESVYTQAEEEMDGSLYNDRGDYDMYGADE